MKTAADLGADLSALDRYLERLHEQANALSLSAVENEGNARKELSDLMADIARTQTERKVLYRAHVQAVARDADAQRATDAATRAGHLNDGREIAARIVFAGERADALIASFVTLMAEIDADEKAAHRSLRAAGEPLSVGQYGRHGIAAIFAERMSAAASFKIGRLSDQRPLLDTLSAAWGHLAMEKENV
jgi:hypothetical protein